MKLSILFEGNLLFQEKDGDFVIRRKGEMEAIILEEGDERVERLYELLKEIIEK